MVLPRVINVAGTEEDSITNGPGLRYVLFVQGCPHHCVGCHNPQTHKFGAGVNRTVEEIYREIRNNPLQTGVTFSGGEPFCQAGPLSELARMLKRDGYDIIVYTGFRFEYLADSPDPGIHDLLELADVIVDGKFILERRDILLKFRGSDNQRILDVKRSLAEHAPIPVSEEDW